MKKKKFVYGGIAVILIVLLLGVSIFFINRPTDNKIVSNTTPAIVEVVETQQENQEENENIIEIQNEKTEETYIVEIPQEEEKKEVIVEKSQPEQPAISQDYAGGFNGYLTHYGPDCAGCGGITASGYDVRNTIYYNDSQYGQLRIVALSKDYPLYTVIRLSNYKGGEIYAIVLDRGGAITGDKIDLLVSSEAEASQLGVQSSVSVDIIRWGK